MSRLARTISESGVYHILFRGVNQRSHLGTYIFWHNLRGGFPPLFLYLQFCRYTLYDRFGNVTKQTNMSGLSETATYNLIGLPTSTTDRKGVTTTYTYNAYGSPLTVSVAGMDTITYTYNVNNVLLRAEQGDNVITYEYDNLGRLTKETENGILKTYQTDKVGNVTYAEIAGVGTMYTYDNLNRMTGATFEGGSAGYTYDDAGRLTGEAKGGITTTYAYNPAGWLTSKTNSDGINTDTYTLTYYADGNIRTKTENGTATTYVYDGRGQLTRENDVVYTYDTRGNRTEKDDGEKETIYTYDENNLLLSEESLDNSAVFYYYDENGNMTCRDSYFDYEIIRSEVMTYDPLNRMTGYRASGVNATYTYGMDNMRRSKTVNGTTTNYIWDGGNIVAEADGNNAITNRYFRGVGLIASKQGETVSYYQTNSHGDVSKWGTVAYSYDAFGNETSETTGTNPFRYNGEYFDEESGFIYLRNRYYDPSIGRFISEDPIQDGLNWYVYCANNPVMFVDPWGLVAGDLFDTIDLAAIDFGQEYYSATDYIMFEIETIIYLCEDSSGNMKYSYIKPIIGEPHTVNCSETFKDLPEYSNLVATIHQHTNNSDFTMADRRWAQKNTPGKPIYIVVPNNTIKVWKPSKTTDNMLLDADGFDIGTERTVSENLELRGLSIAEKISLKFFYSNEWERHLDSCWYCPVNIAWPRHRKSTIEEWNITEDNFIKVWMRNVLSERFVI